MQRQQLVESLPAFKEADILRALQALDYAPNEKNYPQDTLQKVTDYLNQKLVVAAPPVKPIEAAKEVAEPVIDSTSDFIEESGDLEISLIEESDHLALANIDNIGNATVQTMEVAGVKSALEGIQAFHRGRQQVFEAFLAESSKANQKRADDLSESAERLAKQSKAFQEKASATREESARQLAATKKRTAEIMKSMGF